MPTKQRENIYISRNKNKRHSGKLFVARFLQIESWGGAGKLGGKISKGNGWSVDRKTYKNFFKHLNSCSALLIRRKTKIETEILSLASQSSEMKNA